MRTALRGVGVFVATAIVVPIATAGTVFLSFLVLPLPATMPKVLAGVTAQISHIYDINGQEIGQFRQFETTKPVSAEDIDANPWLKKAVVASEDRRFYEHGGVDPIGTIRALWADMRNRGVVQGGSTITQQYVKNAYVGNDRSVSRKIREAILASQLDRQLDKEEILFRYLSDIYLGEGAHGVGAAAETYFRKTSVRDLTLSEAATLSGLIPAPSRYEPRGNVALAEERRMTVLNKMLQQHLITQAEFDQAAPQKLWLAAFGPPPAGQPATVVFPRAEERTQYPYFVDYVRRYIESKYGDDAVYTRGLKIYTTLDQHLQQAAEAEVAKSLEGTGNDPKGNGGQLEMGLATVEPGSGYVKALVGGRDFYAPGGQVNLALGGSSGRQPGSAFKPFVLAEAFEQGVKPTKTYSGRNHFCFPGGAKPYCPDNYGGESFGTVTLRDATKHSINTVYVQLIRDVGVEETVNLAHSLGISRAVPSGDLGLSVALGVIDTSPLEMASAYGVFAARGERAEPTPIVRILDNQDVMLEDNTKPERERVLRETTADQLNDVLQGPLSAGGTAGGKGLKDRPAAGKTGTRQDNRDAWFVGYTPNLSTAVWLGYRDFPVPLERIKGVARVTGGTIPAATWQRYMTEAHKGLDVVKFSEPAPITDVANDAKKKAHGGYEVGKRFFPRGTSDGDAQPEELPPPSVDPPPETTTTTTTPDIFGNNGRGNGTGPGP
jgi:penicillin-binding protein 1A